MANTIEVNVPDIGDYHDVPVIEVLVREGESVDKDQALLVLESDKATMEVPAPVAGIVRNLKPKVGDRISTGTVICQLESSSSDTASPSIVEEEPAPAKEPAPAPAARTVEKPAATQAAAEPAGGGALEVTVPDIGDFKGVPVIEVLVKDGDRVTKDQALLVLESDKATMEVPSPGDGIVRNFKPKVGDKVATGDAVCTLEGAAAVAPATAPAPPPPGAGKAPYAGPATRKFGRELGVDLAQVKGSARGGRITIEDVQGYVKQALKAPPAAPAATASGGSGIPPIPAVDFSQFGAIETKPMSRIRKLSAAHLHRAWVNIPHVTQTDEADITELEAFRKSQSDETGVKLTLLPFIMKACEKAIKAHPEFNASLSPDGESLILKKYLNIGFAADTPNGLVVPVVRDVDRKGIVQLAQECSELAKKARDGKLKGDEMKGGCFSISSLGGIGGSHFTPIVNAPEVGILGVSKGSMKPVWDGKAFVPRLMVPLSLSYDHRVIDGAYGARFMVYLVKLLSDLRRLAL